MLVQDVSKVGTGPLSSYVYSYMYEKLHQGSKSKILVFYFEYTLLLIYIYVHCGELLPTKKIINQAKYCTLHL